MKKTNVNHFRAQCNGSEMKKDEQRRERAFALQAEARRSEACEDENHG